MSYLDFAYPKKKELTNLKPDTSVPAWVVPTAIGGMHYFTWRNVTARDALKEKETTSEPVEHNPEPISGKITRRYQDQNFIQTVQPLQLFRPSTLITPAQSRQDKSRQEQSLRGIVQCAVERELKVKAVGTGHSFADIMTTSDLLVYTDDLDQMLTHVNPESEEGKETIMREINVAHYHRLNPYIKDCGYADFKAGFQSYDGPADQRPAIVEFEGGIKLHVLNEKLWDRGWSLYNLGTYQGQSFIGAVSTSTHGTGLDLGPLPDMILSLVIVGDDGIVYRIEPTKGISRSDDLTTGYPPHFSEFMAKRKKREEEGKKSGDEKNAPAIYASRGDDGVNFLIQDDDFFNSALVNVGTFGLIYSVIIEVIPRFCLLETAEITVWEDLRDRLLKQHKLMLRNITPQQLLLSDPDFLQKHEIFEEKEFKPKGLKYKKAYPDEGIVVNQQLVLKEIRHGSMLFNQNDYDGTYVFRITRLYRVSYDHAIENGWFDDDDKGRLFDKTTKKLLQGSLDRLGEVLEHYEADQKKLYKEKLVSILGGVVFQPLRPNKDVAMLHTVLETIPNLPLFADQPALEAKIEKARKKPIEPEPNEFYLNRNYRVYLKPSDLNGYGIETGFSVKNRVTVQKNDGEKETLPIYIAAIERSMEIAKQHWEEGRYMQTATTAVRFVKGSRAYLSPQYGEPICMIEMLNVADTHGGKELFYRFQRELAKLYARPHWGLDLSVTTGNNDFLKNTYPKFPEWKQVYDLMNQKGTFDNRFTDRMGLSVQKYKR